MGFATAELLAQEGCKLVLSDLDVENLKKDCEHLQSEHLCLAADVTDQGAVDGMVEKAMEKSTELLEKRFQQLKKKRLALKDRIADIGTPPSPRRV